MATRQHFIERRTSRIVEWLRQECLGFKVLDQAGQWSSSLVLTLASQIREGLGLPRV